MPYRVRGSVSEESRVLLFNQSDMTLERSGVFTAGDWELIALDGELKTVVARQTTTGESAGYGDVTPESYVELYTLLSINNIGDFLAIDNLGNGLVVIPA